MKKAIALFTCIGFLLCSFAQETPTEEPTKPVLTKEQYLQKSKSQKIGGIILSSAGGIAAVIGIVVATNELGDDLGGIFDPDYKDENNNEALASVLVIGGLAAIGGSIALFISSNRNQRRAMNVSLKNEHAPVLQQGLLVNRAIPSISLTIRL